MLTVRIWRTAGDTSPPSNTKANPPAKTKGKYQTFRLPQHDNQTILDVVADIQRTLAPDLSYRYACRVGVCGTCAMMVNGKPRWTCRTHVRLLGTKKLTIAPLANMPTIKDLVADMSGFFAKWNQLGGDYRTHRTRQDPPFAIRPDSSNRQAVDEAIACINCGVCYAACRVVEWNSAYLGPAALNRAWTLVRDDRHADAAHTLATATSSHGCANCHSHGQCTAHCPVGISPMASIAGLKRMSLLRLASTTHTPKMTKPA